MSSEDSTNALITALSQLSSEDQGGFKPIAGHRDERVHKALERRGLAYRATTCRPESCQYRHSHGPNPGGDCRREGWQISLRGRLTVESLGACWSLSNAELLATEQEGKYIAVTIICRDPRLDASDGSNNRDFGSGPMLAAVDLPKPPVRRSRRPRGSRKLRRLPIEPTALPKPSTAKLSADAELERLKFKAAQLGKRFIPHTACPRGNGASA